MSQIVFVWVQVSLTPSHEIAGYRIYDRSVYCKVEYDPNILPTRGPAGVYR